LYDKYLLGKVKHFSCVRHCLDNAEGCQFGFLPGDENKGKPKDASEPP